MSKRSEGYYKKGMIGEENGKRRGEGERKGKWGRVKRNGIGWKDSRERSGRKGSGWEAMMCRNKSGVLFKISAWSVATTGQKSALRLLFWTMNTGGRAAMPQAIIYEGQMSHVSIIKTRIMCSHIQFLRKFWTFGGPSTQGKFIVSFTNRAMKML